MSDKKSTKKRNWSFMLYPDSAPSNWKSILEQTGLRIAVSPLHDKDIFSEEDEEIDSSRKAGTLKKPHWHVLLHFDGPTTRNVVSEISDSLCASLPVAVDSLKGMYEYLWHKNNPEKAQYLEDGVLHINGFRIESLAELTSDDILKLKKEIHRIILDLEIYEYKDLLNYLLLNDLDPEYRIASTNTIHFGKLIDSMRHSMSKGGDSECSD